MLCELIHLLTHKAHIKNTAQLLEHTPHCHWHAIAQRIACENNLFIDPPCKEDLEQLTKKHLDQKRKTLIENLIQKSNQTSLSTQEKHQLQSLILEQKT